MNYLINYSDYSADQKVAPKNAFELADDTQNTNEQRVIRQLVEALLFEKLIDYDLTQDIFRFSLANSHYEAKGYIGSFGRIRLVPGSIRQVQQKQRLIININALVDALSAHVFISQKIKHQLLTELQQTVYLCDWNAQQSNKHQDRRQLSYLELESAIDEGHPYHPCFKSRTGFSLKDHAIYGPEQANSFQLHWLAVRRPYLKQNLNNQGDSPFWQEELTTHTWLVLQRRMQELNTSWLEYGLLPIHPWQWNSLQDELLQALSQEDIVYLGAAGDEYQASISVRTLINVTHPQKANIKLPMNMVNSSSLRILEPHSVCTAPLISTWLSDIVSGDSFFKKVQPLGLLSEYAGMLVADPDIDSNLSDEQHQWTKKLAGQLSVIFRQSIDKHDAENQTTHYQTIPFVALTVVETDEKPFIQPWIDQYGCEKWLVQLIDTAIIPVWHLLVHHGIALEAHAQNMILQHENGWPQKIILRDFHESLEYVERYLADATKAPDFLTLYPCYRHAKDNQYYWMTDVEALRELVVDTLFVFNLSDLAMLMERHYQFTENQFWQIIDQRLKNYKTQVHTEAARINAIDIYQQDIQTESLLRKKLSGDSQQEFHHQINNPLSKENVAISSKAAK